MENGYKTADNWQENRTDVPDKNDEFYEEESENPTPANDEGF